MSEPVLYQSALQTGTTIPLQQLSNLKLTGFSTLADSQNTDSGILYGSFTKSGSTYTFNLYSDSTKMDLIATASTTSALPLVVDVSEANDSGLSGTVNFQQYQQDDNLIKAVCFLSVDRDIPMSEIDSLSDFDPENGFAEYHLKAFDKITEHVTGKYQALLFDATWIDTNQINGGLGGFNLSRVLDWKSLREASGYYVLWLLSERANVDPDGLFAKKAAQAKNIFKGYMESVELQFDIKSTRTPQTSRSFRSFKMSRA